MDATLQELIDVLSKTVGNAASYYVLQELKNIGAQPPYDKLTSHQKELLIHSISENVLYQVLSARKIAMFKSHMYYIMRISSRSAALISRTESSKWTG